MDWKIIVKIYRELPEENHLSRKRYYVFDIVDLFYIHRR